MNMDWWASPKKTGNLSKFWSYGTELWPKIGNACQIPQWLDSGFGLVVWKRMIDLVSGNYHEVGYPHKSNHRLTDGWQ